MGYSVMLPEKEDFKIKKSYHMAIFKQYTFLRFMHMYNIIQPLGTDQAELFDIPINYRSIHLWVIF